MADASAGSSQAVLEGASSAALTESEPESQTDVEQKDDEKGKGDAPAPEVREKWDSKLNYILTLVGYAVGFGNIWRFPYQMRENGGLVFLIPYTIMVLIIGVPIFFMELAVGQRRRKGIVYAWAEISPCLGGIGISCGIICFMVSLYYNTFLAYSMSYMMESFRNPLPWTNCSIIAYYTKESEKNVTYKQCHENMADRATKFYWFRDTLGLSTSFDEPGNYSWYLFLYLTISWIIIYVILVKGLKVVSYVVYFTALFPYLVLICFFIGNLAHEHSDKSFRGAYRLVKPDWSLLYQPLTWLKAGSQIFYSLGLAEGCLAVFASYNPVRNNCYKDAILISIINCATSLFAALVVFPLVGRLGHDKYDECIKQMTLLLPKSSLANLKENYYDVYYFTKAKTWEEVANHSILLKYGYDEMSSADKDSFDFEKHFSDGGQEEFDVLGIKDINSTLSGSLVGMLRDCSIGLEATASGGGTGFVFVGFTEAVLSMNWSNFWAIIFFLMLITLGIDSGFALVAGFANMLEDLIRLKGWIATSITCASLYLLALLLFPFGWGAYILDFLDQWTANWSLLMIASLECIAVSWDYGLAKISYDILLMTGKKPNLYILLCWKYVSPIVIIIMLLATLGQYLYSAATDRKQLQYTAFDPTDKNSVVGDVSKPMPGYVLAIGCLVFIFCIMWIPVHAILRKTKYNMLRDEKPAAFPEDELRAERNVDVQKEEDQFTDTEKIIMGQQSIQNLQKYRDETKRQSEEKE